jgi:hypothetical protein
MRNETAWMLPGFSCRELVAVLIRYNKEGAERRLVVCSAYLPKIPRTLLCQRNLRTSCDIVKMKTYLVVGCDSNAHHSVWGSTNCNSRGEALVEFLNSLNLETLNRGNEPTFCSGSRLEVIGITLASLKLLESIIGLEVSSEPFLSDHRHILFTLGVPHR